ncbi:MAG: type I restriction-modification system endonuclease [Polyangiaceae bacterium]|nr:type I restriction-modification system endonuclease [Polyangiaceae bacterium]
MNTNPSPNFAFLAYHDARLVALATQAEEHFGSDPVVTLFKLRQFGEALAQRAAAKVGLYASTEEPQQQLIDRLWERNVIGATQRMLFHNLRRVGNAAVHDGKGGHSEALHQLRMARELAVWFQRSFGNNKKFEAGPFVPPAEPSKSESTLHDELQRLRDEVEARRQELEAAQRAIEEAKKAAEAEAAEKLTALERAAKAKEDAAIWEALAEEQIEAHRETAKAEAHKSGALTEQNEKLRAELAALQAAAQAMPPKELAGAIQQASEASEAIELDEAATRKLIDRQLSDAGWEVDSERLTFKQGVRPTKGKNLAIAEWPTRADGNEGWADYVLFAGLQVVAVVEAKRKHKDVMGVIPQAKRYSVGYLVKGDEFLPEGSPWGAYQVPFLFATNGRPFLRQLRTKSGVWFLDARRPQNHPVALEGWYTPEGLVDLLRQNIDEAHARLHVEPMPYIDREYQRNAILAVEHGLEAGKRELLVAMATGTGKTRTCIGLCYRLLKTKRFRRVLFLVDRNALGRQTADALKDLRLENLQTFTDIFDVKELADIRPQRETKLHIATIQAMVKRVLGPFSDGGETDIPPVDQYDCVVVDECHRGYLLDRELSDREFLFRDEEDYISKYRRVLDHFDAAKIGLTATPALHTKEIFGAPIFSYSYREAVVDGFLVDHEPPIHIVTKLAHDGIHYNAHEEVLMLDRSTQTLKKEELADEIQFEVDAFNKRVITEHYNRAVLAELVNHIDPEQDEKTLIFCATDEHADMVVLLLKDALRAKYGSVDDDAVAKITGATDRPLEALRRYRNERHPNIAVTVDLLTTGIDVPKIANLVFLRRVRSRILYEQMIGRATRLCPDIGKERFRIFDAVDLYSALKDVTDMKPVVVNPFVSFEQLRKEVVEGKEEEFRRTSLEEFLAKLQRKKRWLTGAHEESFQSAAGMDVKALTQFLKKASVGEAADYLRQHFALAAFLDRTLGSGANQLLVSEKADELLEVRRGYGKHGSRPPGDYLEAFRAFVAENMNKLPALLVVTQRPRDLTREDLRQLKLMLDQEGFGEKAVQSAWRDQKNEDIAATIVGYIRQLALGSPLMPYTERVDGALRRLRKAHKFTDPQVKWLDRIAKQVKLETVVDRASLDTGQFKTDGGFARLNKVFEGQLDSLLGELADEVWKDAG